MIWFLSIIASELVEHLHWMTKTLQSASLTRGGGYYKTYRDVPQIWVSFLQEIPRHGQLFFSVKNP